MLVFDHQANHYAFSYKIVGVSVIGSGAVEGRDPVGPVKATGSIESFLVEDE